MIRPHGLLIVTHIGDKHRYRFVLCVAAALIAPVAQSYTPVPQQMGSVRGGDCGDVVIRAHRILGTSSVPFYGRGELKSLSQ